MRTLRTLMLSIVLSIPALVAGCSDDPVSPTQVSPVTNLTPSTVSETSVTLTWDYAAAVDSFRILRSGAQVASLASTARSYTDTGLTANTTYTYSVVAVKGTAVSAEASSTFRTSAAGGGTQKRARLAGNINGVRTLSADTVYTISGFVFVQPGARLEIPAGTRLEGDTDPLVQGSSLVTMRGTATKPSGQIIAEGTAANPIVFTSGLPAGQRKRGDWGGIVLSGLADLNLDGKTGSNEGVPGSYGPGGVLPAPRNDDNSGVLRYVRIEFGGTKVSPDNEINGLTLNAVGSGTTIEHVQTHMIADDGFEWFGGTVNGRYLVSSGNDDDAFDMDFGYSGKLQFLFGLQDPTLANRGFEIDNDGSGSEKTPYTSATVMNVTLVGSGRDKANNEDNDGLYLRKNNRLKIYNALVTNFRYALVIDGASTKRNVDNDDLVVRNSILNGRTGPYNYKDGSAADLDAAIARWNVRTNVPEVLGSVSFDAPNPIPSAVAATGAIDPTSVDAYFTSASYVGAFAPGGQNWASGWTSFAR